MHMQMKILMLQLFKDITLIDSKKPTLRPLMFMMHGLIIWPI